ncbi:MAG: valine--tRNA ligase [Maricaulaceae bacterium]
MIDKAFDPASSEPRLYAQWEASGAFQPISDPDAPSFSIVIPPPNVTGRLHIGHALNNTLQDVLVRWKRMQGFAVLWQPGTDHAGIATQMVVERQLAETQSPDRRSLGREAFIDKVWAWKAESGGVILDQLKRLGASCDWSRERFTLDEGLSAAVRTVFVALYREGLLYRDTRLVNWDPKFQTAVSDLEVENVEQPGKMWRFRYPLADGETFDFPTDYDEDGRPTAFETRDYIVVATTRPETMLADGAVAVHPNDARYQALVGKQVRLPLADRLIPIIADEYPDPDKGSGAVKITGAHDFNDYEVARRHDLPLYVIFDDQARMIAPAPEKYVGLDRFDARKAVIADIDALGLLDGIDDKSIMQPFGDRSGVIIEPMLTDQWFVRADILAQEAITAVEDGRTRFVPETWSKTYFNWMRNIQPWCVSRQLWWGHRIPAWYGPEGSVLVAETESEARAEAEARFGPGVALTQDEDVLDTWFSSALWPFSTLGWPEETDELKRFYPTSVLVTAFDIIFFWVARMMMQGLHFQKQIPFHDVYIHALVRDEQGQKMSKSKGNVIDPLALVDEFGADALRFTLAALAAQGRDIRMSKDRVAGYRNFATKLWNAARFCQMNDCRLQADFDPAQVQATVNRWIVSETVKTVHAVDAGLEGYRFNEAAGALYRFAWNVYCDWYLEFAKPLFTGEDAAAKAETRATAAWALDQILKLLHPFMPFISEELWAAMAEGGAPRKSLLISAPWPRLDAGLIDEAACAEMGWVVVLITEIRSTRNDMNVPAAAKTPLVAIDATETAESRLHTHEALINRLARAEPLSLASSAPKGAVQIILEGATLCLPLGDVIDISAEIARLEKERQRLDGEVARIDKKLGNDKFLAKAPSDVVEAEKSKRADYETAREKVITAIDRLEAL